MGLADRRYMYRGEGHASACTCVACEEERLKEVMDALPRPRGKDDIEFRQHMAREFLAKIKQSRGKKVSNGPVEDEVYLPYYNTDGPCEKEHSWSLWGKVSFLPKGFLYKVCTKCGRTLRRRIE